MKSSLTTNSQPRCVAVGDVNNDNQMDIVVANSGTNTIGIFLSKGDGTFADQQTYFTGSESRPYCIAVSDFNNDNHLDVVIANYGTHNIGIFLGNGNGTFVDQKLFSLGPSHPLFITTGNFNKDNRTDIVVANYGTDSISILLGYGDGSFQDQIIYSTGYDSIPSSLAVGDLNKDDHLDIVVANYGTNNIGIFFGYGNGTFTSQKTYTTALNSNPSSVAVADFNNDNKLDIAVTNNGSGNLGIFLGQGNGTFVAQTTYSTGSNSNPQYIAVGDFNKDNQLDIAIVDAKNDRLHIFPGYGSGNFATVTTYDTISGSSPYSIAATDVNNNNQSDVVITNYGTNNVFALIDYSFKPSTRQTNYNVGSPTIMDSVALSDLNNDHIFDIIFGVGNKILILTGLGNGMFSTEATYSTDIKSFAQYICVGDLNNDNRIDIVSANIDSDSVGVLLGYGDGTFADIKTYSAGIGSRPVWVALGDINNDNRLDIVSVNAGTRTIGIYRGNGDGIFDIMVNNSIDTFGDVPSAVDIVDINNDNYLDIVIVTNVYYLIIYLGNGDTTFIFSKKYAKDSGTQWIASADFNSDTHLDIVVANTAACNIGVFLGYGNGTFTEQTTYSTGFASYPYSAIVADFNNDNIYDIAVSSSGTDKIVIFYGDGNGSFELKRIYSTGFGSKPFGITAADFDNNKQIEIVVVLLGTGDIAILNEYYVAEFANQTIYSTGSASQPYSVAIGDFNNDNRSDIVVANSGTDNLDILFNSNNNTFNIKMTYSIDTGSQPQYVITCDINKDDQLDIVSINSKSDNISVIMGYGNGTFKEQMIYSTGHGSHPYAGASDDFNNDTLLDLVIANEGTNSIGIFLAYNYTSFQSQMTFSSSDSLGPIGVVISNFNNDNYLDIAAVFYTVDQVGILLGCGNGCFSSMITHSTGDNSRPFGIAVGDFNNDGQLDIVVTNSRTDNVGVLLGYGNGSFTAVITYSTGGSSYPTAVAVGDINNDDQLDIIVSNFAACNVGILFGYGNGSFSVVKTYSTGETSFPYSFTLIDLDIDGQLDIIVANFGASNIGIFFGYGNGSFQNQLTYSTGYPSGPADVTVADFNNDNRLDIAVPILNRDNVGILLGYGNRTFAEMMTYSTGAGSTPMCVLVSDLNDDNHLDIVVANIGTTNIVVLFGFGDGSFLFGTPYSTGGIGSKPSALAIDDLNKDGRLDIIVSNHYENNIGVFYGYGNELFASMTSYTTGDGSHPHSVAIGDFNNDGWSDIVVANYGTDNVGILLGRRNGIFDPIITYITGNGSAPYSVAVIDCNNNTHLDIVVTNSETDSISILFGYGNGTFAFGVTYFTGTRSRPYTVAVGDFNNDNIFDIAVANSGTSNIFLLYGYGNGTFGNETSYLLGYGYHPYSIAVIDLNQDNWMDIVIACYDTDHVEILRNMC